MTEQVALPPTNARLSYNESFKRDRERNSYASQSLFDIAGY